MTFKKILVPLDGSLLAEAALPKAAELMDTSADATLVLVRAAQATTMPGVDPIEVQVSVVHEAEDYLEAVAVRLRGLGVPQVRTSVWYGAAAPSILEAAKLAKADLIMMSTHGRSGLSRLVLGSVAESVLRGARTPVFLIRVDDASMQELAARAGAREQEGANV